jgi:bifunctional enzyme CysN/CysC/sulfate adenylyltransferase subunit 1
MSQKDTLKIVIVGHVDHGKSTLIGRLFFDTGSIPEVRYREIEELCKRQGRPFEFAYLMDALEEERDQNVTIDTAQTFFKTKKRPYVIIDAPGHREFLKNMITGAASADAAILLLDGVEGVREQTRRHAYMLSLLGIRQVIVAVNKLDMAGYSREVFQAASNDILAFLHPLGIVPSYIIPISASEGENIQKSLGKTPWYEGPSILEALDSFRNVRAEEGLDFRFPVQDVYKFDGYRRYAGRIETGSIAVGDEVVFTPSGRRTAVKTIEKWQKPDIKSAGAGECVGLTFEDEVFVERGEVLARCGAAPTPADELRASVFWLSNNPLERGKTYKLKLATVEVEAKLVDIEERFNSSSLEIIERHAGRLETTEAGNVIFSLKRPIAAETYVENSRLGRFVLEDGMIIGGGGIIREVRSAEGTPVRLLSLDERLATEPDGNQVDLTNLYGEVKFAVTPRFLGLLAKGDRVLFRLRDASQIGPVALLAYENNLGFTFRRDRDEVSVVFHREKAPSPLPTSGEPVI